jgi:hypothetical protein
MVSTCNNTITQYPCFCVPYLEGTEPIVLKTTTLDLGIPDTVKQVLAFLERAKP